ncbi:helix-turn-helix domain-containing protein [Streptomyces sp. GbtcB7]|uniref:helix-turn-helix domain-containing protein n=1 Tax=Streptomyces sp. GbtcB7 TaxID=2824752 RepID=UPI001C311862|nr:helix-turn-helix domain-containing protein [Streptomyces sp. GbtcB7]
MGHCDDGETPHIGYLSAAELNKWTGHTIKLLAADTSEPGPGTDMAIALPAMFAQVERIYMLRRAVGARAAKEARGLPTGRPAKLNATTRAGAAQRIKDGAIPEQVAAELGVSRSTLYRELRKHRESISHEG